LWTADIEERCSAALKGGMLVHIKLALVCHPTAQASSLRDARQPQGNSNSIQTPEMNSSYKAQESLHRGDRQIPWGRK
jgi:hypothetical protein